MFFETFLIFSKLKRWISFMLLKIKREYTFTAFLLYALFAPRNFTPPMTSYLISQLIEFRSIKVKQICLKQKMKKKKRRGKNRNSNSIKKKVYERMGGDIFNEIVLYRRYESLHQDKFILLVVPQKHTLVKFGSLLINIFIYLE